MAFEKIKIETTVNSNLEHVWNCYTEPEHITKWNFASEDWQCPWAKNDLRVGGKYIARMEAKDAENQNPIEMQQQGWQAILNNFTKYAEQ